MSEVTDGDELIWVFELEWHDVPEAMKMVIKPHDKIDLTWCMGDEPEMWQMYLEDKAEGQAHATITINAKQMKRSEVDNLPDWEL
ncbi:MAG: hypothetical protein CL607_14990 [Anaerolineaceae bacterium]|nr:hypothetical protein [Anaerolineaceae bacterium]